MSVCLTPLGEAIVKESKKQSKEYKEMRSIILLYYFLKNKDYDGLMNFDLGYYSYYGIGPKLKRKYLDAILNQTTFEVMSKITRKYIDETVQEIQKDGEE